MATEVTIGGSGALFVGEDKTIVLSVVDDDGVPVNIGSWLILFDVRVSDKAPDPAIFSITCAITGTYNVAPLVNTQRASATLTDDQMNTVRKKTYRHSWKRMTANFETVLSYGDFEVEKATAP